MIYANKNAKKRRKSQVNSKNERAPQVNSKNEREGKGKSGISYPPILADAKRKMPNGGKGKGVREAGGTEETENPPLYERTGDNEAEMTLLVGEVL